MVSPRLLGGERYYRALYVVSLDEDLVARLM